MSIHGAQMDMSVDLAPNSAAGLGGKTSKNDSWGC